MNICGIIMECNPLHKGHVHLIQKAGELTGADYILAVMSGDYVQRGTPAIADKYLRARMLLQAGAHGVLELPLPYATGSAGYFAEGAIQTLSHTGIVTHLCFGSETGDLTLLQKACDRFKTDNSSEKETTPLPSRKGQLTAFSERPAPNDVLAMAYLNTLARTHSPMIPLTIPRKGASYHSRQIMDGYASASYIREELYKGDTASENDWRELEKTHILPSHCIALLREYTRECNFVRDEDISPALFYVLSRLTLQTDAHYYDVSADLLDKIQKNAGSAATFKELCDTLKSRDLTHSHIRRALLHILLDIREEDMLYLRDKTQSCPWLRLLGFRRDAAPLIRSLKAHADRPVLEKLSEAKDLLPEASMTLLEKEMAASHYYRRLANKNGGILSEYRRERIYL